MKLLITFAVLTVTASAFASVGPRAATLTIRHETHGCHSWSVDGKSWSAAQKLTLAPGALLTVKNLDVMPHTFVQVSGPKAKLAHASMSHMGAQAFATFAVKGKYVFTTKPGEDYMKGVKTTGEDNVLRLVVTVS
jgi:plastocyanin